MAGRMSWGAWIVVGSFIAVSAIMLTHPGRTTVPGTTVTPTGAGGSCQQQVGAGLAGPAATGSQISLSSTILNMGIRSRPDADGVDRLRALADDVAGREDRVAAAYRALDSRVCGIPAWRKVLRCTGMAEEQAMTVMAANPDVGRPGSPVPDGPLRDSARLLVAAEDQEAVRLAAITWCVDEGAATRSLATPPVANAAWRRCAEASVGSTAVGSLGSSPPGSSSSGSPC